MAVYPFYIESRPEGRKTPISGGCKRKDGYQETYIYQRDEGQIRTVFKVVQNSFLNEQGERVLSCQVVDENGFIVATKETKY